MNIFLDMDDVVADWRTRAHEILGKTWDDPGFRIPQEDWNKLKADERYYLNLPLKPGAQELVVWCRSFVAFTGGNLRFLTALPHDYSMPFAANDKVLWAQEHFPDVPVFFGPFSHDKWRYCTDQTDILIDDRVSNCTEWTAQGGRAHVYTTWENCKPWLESIWMESMK